jgi:hypothetical protein
MAVPSVEISRSLGIVVGNDKIKNEILNRSRIESGTWFRMTTTTNSNPPVSPFS